LMRIKIAQRFYPFSHVPGTECLLPGSPVLLRVFPARLEVYNASSWPEKFIGSVSFPVGGVVERFTVQQDLEHSCVKVWGHCPEGYFCYRVVANVPGPTLIYEKQPESWKKENFEFDLDYPQELHDKGKRLSLGNHKKQDWELISRRCDLTEILPIWLRLSDSIPIVEDFIEEGVCSLFSQAEDIIAKKNVLDVVSIFKKLFLSGFHGIMVPRLDDDQYQGIVNSGEVETETSPLQVLSRGAELIEKLFIQLNGNVINILPVLASEFHCGRFTGILCGDQGSLDMEWSKKLIKKVIFHAAKESVLKLRFQKGVKTFRLRESIKDKGVRVSCGSDIEISTGKTYFLDNFQK
jgi:hypothetical protein